MNTSKPKTTEYTNRTVQRHFETPTTLPLFFFTTRRRLATAVTHLLFSENEVNYSCLEEGKEGGSLELLCQVQETYCTSRTSTDLFEVVKPSFCSGSTTLAQSELHRHARKASRSVEPVEEDEGCRAD